MGSSVILPPTGQPTTGPDPLFVPSPSQNAVSFNFDRIGPPSHLYVQRDDELIVNTWANSANITVRLAGRILIPQQVIPGQPTKSGETQREFAAIPGGYIQLLIQDIVVPANRTRNVTNIQLLEGYLIDVALYTTGTFVPRGQCFGVVQLARGGVSLATAVEGLLADYLLSANNAGWPGGRIVQSTEGPGWKHSLQVANPAAGTDWTLTVANGQRLRIETFAATLVAANAGTPRALQLIVDDGANTLFIISANATQAINTTATYTGGALGTPSTINPNDLQVNIPSPLILEPGWRLRTSTTNLQGADQWGPIWLNVEEWIETT